MVLEQRLRKETTLITTIDRAFNLIDEPWILVRTKDEKVQEASLKEVLLNSQCYLELAGETKTQDFAVLRLLLAITHTVVTRFSAEGLPEPLEDDEEALERWSAIWEEGRLPQNSVLDYLNEYHDRFWLFSEDRPFMQTEVAKRGTFYRAGKLDGSLAESSNKVRLFQMKHGAQKEALAPAAAARWLINLNGYDDTSAKASAEYRKKVTEKKSSGAGWLGRLGLIFATGETLFQTLMLNTILIQPNGELYPADLPYWEQENPDVSERREIAPPANLAALYTLPSRRISLERTEDNHVNGYYILGGDFFSRENAFIEPFTLWKKTKAVKGQPENQVPARHAPGKKFWRDFGNLIPLNDASRPREPGIVSWIQLLEAEDLLPENYIVTFEAPTVYYGDKDFFVQDLSSQNLTLYAALLNQTGIEWRLQIEKQIEKIEKFAQAAGFLAKDYATAAGKSGDALLKDADAGQSLLYQLADAPFRAWIASLNPDNKADTASMQTIAEAVQRWNSQARNLARQVESRLMTRSGGLHNQNALLGRAIEDKNGKTVYMSVPDATERFWIRINKLYPAKSPDSNEKRENIE